MTVTVDGNNDVDISTSGVSLTGVDASLSGGSFTVAGATFDASDLDVAYTSADPDVHDHRDQLDHGR